jgi:hemolysin activation/secretion protein
MKRSLLMAAVLLAGTSTIVSAGTIKPFVGVDYSKVNTTVDESVTLSSGSIAYSGVTYNAGDSLKISTSADDSAFALKLGVVLASGDRAYLQRVGYSKSGTDVTLTTVNYDYMFTGSSDFTPYMGVSLGQAELKSPVASFSNNGTAYGLRAGALMPVNDNLSFDLNVGYSVLNLSKSVSYPAISGNGVSGITYNNAALSLKQEIDTATNINVGLVYAF